MTLTMKDGGWRLRATRAERGLTEDALAVEIRRWADLHGTPRPEITASTIAEWEAGARPIDGAALRLLWLALVAPNRCWADPDVAVWSLFRPAGRRPDDAARRQEFLDYAASFGEPVGLEPDRLDAMLEEAIRVDSRAVEGLGFVARQLRKRLGTEPPHATRRLAHAHLEAVLALLDHTVAGDLRRHLEAAAATTAVFAGIVSIYVCRLEPASIYLELGQRLAREAGDVETEAIGLLAASRLHSQISPVGPSADPARAQELLEAADRRLGRRTAPAANAWVLLREAEELAGRDERAALRLVDEADRLALGAGAIPADGLCCRWSTEMHVAYRGNVNVLAGRPARGIPLLEAALAALPSSAVASRPLATADLGGAYAMQGEVDHACALLREALAMAMAAGLPEAVTRVRAARELRLAAHGRAPAVRDLDDELRAAGTLAP